MSYSRAKGWQTKPKPGCFVDPMHPLSYGLVGCWIFNEGAGSRLVDYSSYGSHGVLTNMNPGNDWVGSPRGGALNFDGTNDYVNIPLVNSSASASWCARVMLLSNGNYPIIMSSVGAEKYWELRFSLSARKPQSLWAYGNSSNIVDSPDAVGLNEWHHLVLTVTTAGVQRLYVDGVDKANSTGTISAPPNNFQIGDRGTGGLPFPGRIEDVRIFNRVLSTNEIKWLYYEPYANILQPTWRKYFVPAAARYVGGDMMPFFP